MSPSNNADNFDLAILYWFYKEQEVTKNHLELIRKYNPDRKIYGLFGGDRAEADAYKASLGGLIDDFWAYPGTFGDDRDTKWIHGDLMILDWYDQRGRDLPWDSLAITQWDMVLFDNIADITPGIQKDQVFFSGYRELDESIENRWMWTKPDGEHRRNYLAFLQHVKNKYGYDDKLKCSLYIYEILTRPFFDKCLERPDKKLGMLEYKNPTLAKIFGLNIYEHDAGVYWMDISQSVETSPLNARAVAIKADYIRTELAKPGGWRLFHPYEKVWPSP